MIGPVSPSTCHRFARRICTAIMSARWRRPPARRIRLPACWICSACTAGGREGALELGWRSAASPARRRLRSAATSIELVGSGLLLAGARMIHCRTAARADLLARSTPSEVLEGDGGRSAVGRCRVPPGGEGPKVAC